jgi:hypothetical protein
LVTTHTPLIPTPILHAFQLTSIPRTMVHEADRGFNRRVRCHCRRRTASENRGTGE